MKLHVYGPKQWPAGKGQWVVEIYTGMHHSGSTAKHLIWAAFWTAIYLIKSKVR